MCALSAMDSMCMDVSDGKWKTSSNICAQLRGLCHNRCKVQSIIPITSHGEDEAQVLQYLFKQDNQVTLHSA